MTEKTYTEATYRGKIAELCLIREDKRNAMSDGLLAEIEAFYAGLPKETRVVILHGRGGHYCSGLDLSEHVSRSAEDGVHHSRNWHRVLDMIQFGGAITVSAMTGAVIGGGLELATATHVRIAEPSVIFQLPEGRRGIFVGGGATVRGGRIIGWRASWPTRSRGTRRCRITSWCTPPPGSRTCLGPMASLPRASPPRSSRRHRMRRKACRPFWTNARRSSAEEGGTGREENRMTQSEMDRAHAAWAQENTRVGFLPHRVTLKTRDDGTMILTSDYPLGEAARNTGVWLHDWAEKRPDRVAISERDADGTGWRDVTYAALLERVRAIGAALVARGLGQGDTIAFLSGNGLDHLVLSLAAQYVGVPVVPLAEQYSLIPEAHGRLIYVLNRVRPAMVFVDDADRYAQALALPELEGVEIVAARGKGPRDVTPMAALMDGAAEADVDAAHAQVGPDTLAKILFTSGSSSDPKGVLTTHGMMCVNQLQLAASMPFLADRPPEITDWLPWNHVFGGSHNVNLILSQGGTLTIDLGKPTGKGFDTTLENRIERPGTLAFNVPVGFDMLTRALADRPEARKKVFGALDLIFYAGASLPQNVWDALEEYSMEAQGALPLMISSWGLTETAPAAVIVHEPIGRSGVIGVPVPGLMVKLIPDDEMRCEIRVKGPNVMKGYHDDPDRTAAAFDEEGFFITGDAVRFVDAADPSRGLLFDGRVSEDFKLNTGTWVQAGSLRMNALAALKGIAQDVVICGHDRGEIGLFVFPPAGAVGPDADTSDGAVTDATFLARVEEALRMLNVGATGSARRIARALVLQEPPSLEASEITDKGSLNPRRIITRRAALLERLYDNEDPALIRV